MFKKHNQKILELLSNNSNETRLKSTLKEHQVMLKRIQHERFIHLLVTIFVGTIMSLTFLVIIVAKSIILLFIGVPLLILFIGYLIHYRFLENTTQSWYTLEDKIINKVSKTD